MSYMFEVYYHGPPDSQKEDGLISCVKKLGGRLDYREAPDDSNNENTICLTFEFDDCANAESVAKMLRDRGEHVEGPQEYDREPTHA